MNPRLSDSKDYGNNDYIILERRPTKSYIKTFKAALDALPSPCVRDHRAQLYYNSVLRSP